MIIKDIRAIWFCVITFAIVFYVLPFSHTIPVLMMPGDLGDARLNNYFLENIYQFFTGGSNSLWHLGFFAPFPYVLGLSDNLFGAAPVYVLARALSGQSDTAFQIWFLFSYVANFLAAYYALWRLGSSPLASMVGALIFAFALPTTAHMGHGQLYYRFGVPLALSFFIRFLEEKEWHLLRVAGAWLVWQFYCGIYIGFFTLFMLAVATVVHFSYCRYRGKIPIAKSLQDFTNRWGAQTRQEKSRGLLYLVVFLVLLFLLFYPYLQVSRLYGVGNSWIEIASMLPRPQSYFLSDVSYLWSSPTSKVFAEIPMRHEHQMFIGAIPMLLATLGFLIGNHDKNGYTFTLMSGILGGVILLTMYVGGFSLWYLLHRLPLVSAIRAITRFDLVLLFPAAYLAAVAIDQLRSHRQWVSRVILVIVLPLMIFEFYATSFYVSPKKEWRDRLTVKDESIPIQLPEHPILFFAQSEGVWSADELDAMWVSLNHGVKTMNGYSGHSPPLYNPKFGKDCSELQLRIHSYLSFRGQSNNPDAYLGLMKRMVPIGFDGCDKEWFTTSPITTSDRQYSSEEIRNLTYRFEGRKIFNGQTVVELKLSNSGHTNIAARSSIGKPIRISWRFLDVSGKPCSEWNTRKDLPLDIPAQGDISIRISIDPKMEVKGGSLQISLVQEFVFWGHDIGFQSLTVPWD